MTDDTPSNMRGASPQLPNASQAKYLRVHFQHFRTSIITLLVVITGLLLWLLTYDAVVGRMIGGEQWPSVWTTVGVILLITTAALLADHINLFIFPLKSRMQKERERLIPGSPQNPKLPV